MAGRKSKLNWTNSRDQYTATIAGTFYLLGKDKEEAEKKFRWCLNKNHLTEPIELNPTFASIADEWLEHVKNAYTSARYRICCCRISEFAQYVGEKMKVNDLKPSHFEAWLETKAPLKPGTVRLYTGIILAALNWASSKKIRLIPSNPLKGMLELPEGGSRGGDVVWKKETFEMVLQVANKAFADVVRILAWTGARPNTICKVEAKHFIENLRIWDFSQKQTPHVNRKKHVKRIWLTDQAINLVKQLNEKHPVGPIFRNSKGEPWTPDSLGLYFYQLRHKFKETKNLGWQPGICLYGLRHTFATSFIRDNPNKLLYLKELMGHKDLKMIMKHYGHLFDENDAVLEVLNQTKIF